VLSRTTERFRSQPTNLPKPIQDKAASAYALWSANPEHPALRFKNVHSTQPIYTVRIDRAWRAVGALYGDTVVWFWIGSHGDYEALLRNRRTAPQPGAQPGGPA
jgi:hypothetical protein